MSEYDRNRKYDESRAVDDEVPLHPGYEQRDGTRRYDNYEVPHWRHKNQAYDEDYEPDVASSREPMPSAQNQLAPYDEEKAYAEWHRGAAEREAQYDRELQRQEDEEARRDHQRRRYEAERRRYEDEEQRRYDDERRRYEYEQSRRRQSDNERRYQEERRQPRRSSDRHDKDKNIAGALLGGGAGALLGRELIGKGALGTIGGAVVGAIAAKGVENYEDKKKREKDEERARIRKDYDSASYDPRGSYRNSNFYDSEYASPAASTISPGRQPPGRRRMQRHRREVSSSDSFTSDD